eukprot:gene13836-19757_t
MWASREQQLGAPQRESFGDHAKSLRNTRNGRKICTNSLPVTRNRQQNTTAPFCRFFFLSSLLLLLLMLMIAGRGGRFRISYTSSPLPSPHLSPTMMLAISKMRTAHYSVARSMRRSDDLRVCGSEGSRSHPGHSPTPVGQPRRTKVCTAAVRAPGNGIYAQGQVRALSKLGHQVFVISAKPEGFQSQEVKQGASELVEVAVSHWGKLDASAPYAEYAKAASDPNTIAKVKAFAPEVVLAVDWSTLPLLEAAALAESIDTIILSRSDSQFLVDHVLSHSELEAAALAESIDTVVLSRSDRQFLVDHVLPHSKISNGSGDEEVHKEKKPRIDPGADVEPAELAAAESFASSRPYLTCCVRLSPEKEAELFVGLVEELGKRGLLQTLNLVPLMVGSAKDDYAEKLKTRLRAVDDSVVILESFMGPSQLAEVLGKTRLNVHPATYDAFGMTIVEAASQGAASLVHDGNGAVGATDLLRGAEGEVLLVDMDKGSVALADKVEEVLGDEGKIKLLHSARQAAHRARGWSEEENAKKLTALVRVALGRHNKKGSKP